MEQARKIVMQAVDNPNTVEALLVTQLAHNPRGFCFSDRSIAKIEKRTNALDKMLIAVKCAIAENIIE